MIVFDDTLLAGPGEAIEPEELSALKARDLLKFLKAEVLPYVRFVQTRRSTEDDVVVFDVEPEVPQAPVADIRRTERLAVSFSDDDHRMPETISLRSSFPLVPHLNPRSEGYPWKSLCLFEETYPDLKLRWTAAFFVRRVQAWLTRTARGDLHESDQPLEPFLLGNTIPLVIPPALFSENDPERSDLVITAVGTSADFTLIARRGQDENHSDGLRFAAVRLKAQPQVHGVIWSQPKTLSELQDLVAGAGLDILAALRDRLGGWRHDNREILDSKLVLILWLPKKRKETSPVEATDIWAFLTAATLKDVGEALGLWQVQNDEIADLIPRDLARRGEDVQVDILRPVSGFSSEGAAYLSGTDQESAKVTAVGAGALGSQVILNLIRSGWGRWDIVDNDHLLPHNLARHALPGWALGSRKAPALATVANNLFQAEDVACGIVADALQSQDHEALRRSLSEADLVVDLSASVTVARHLAIDVQSPARRISLFLSPDGSDLVLLVEDKSRRIRLDDLEMQYYREVVNRPEFADHLRADGRLLRYAHSCRDVTGVIPQDLVCLHAGLGARAIRSANVRDQAKIALWRVGDDLEVDVLTVDPVPVVRRADVGWEIRTNESVSRTLHDLRARKLPNETGGVLVGHHDQEHRILYVADALPSPPDSEEWPTVYIRGCEGLRDEVRRIEDCTGGMLTYVGEWHSHPDGRGVAPSDEDRKVFAWLGEHMAMDCLPPLMVIVGEEEQGWHLGRLT